TAADFAAPVQRVGDGLDAGPAAVQLPIGAEGLFRGVIDLLELKAHVWDETSRGEEWQTLDSPEEFEADAEQWRHELVDVLSQHDEVVLEKYVGEEEITAADLRRAPRNGTTAKDFLPALGGTAFKNKGVQPLLDAVVDYLPSPLD